MGRFGFSGQPRFRFKSVPEPRIRPFRVPTNLVGVPSERSRGLERRIIQVAMLAAFAVAAFMLLRR